YKKASYFANYGYYYFVISNNFNIKENNLLNCAQETDFKAYLPDDILTKVDRASLSVSLESRPPLLDSELIELSYRIPPNLRFNNKILKYIFKKSVEDRVLNENIYKDKKGFAIDLKNMRTEIDIKYDYFKKFIPEHYFNKIISDSNNPKYWSILSYYNWCKYNEM
ncbi:MAG: asparagine synthase C-terminal domain-containing protein, partial [Candidatus ainarchaeum sp.]|nr:asparagine synthase C-terminal domain-containing protein [Candidatus ainarchaeum sp.]